MTPGGGGLTPLTGDQLSEVAQSINQRRIEAAKKWLTQLEDDREVLAHTHPATKKTRSQGKRDRRNRGNNR